MKGKFLIRECLKKWRNMGSRVIPCTSSSSSAGCSEHCYQWEFWASMKEYLESLTSNSIPKDVPKGHLVVYVGDKYKRFVIKISLLKHPLFKALLDQAQDEYDFTTTHDSKLCIPCDESIFLDVVRCASSPQDEDSRISLCVFN